MKIRLRNGKEVEAVEVDFEAMKEDWSEYKLEDGTILKFKTVITNIIRTDDYDPMTGNPIYQVRSTSIMRVKVPEKLKHLPSMEKPSDVEVA